MVAGVATGVSRASLTLPIARVFNTLTELILATLSCDVSWLWIERVGLYVWFEIGRSWGEVGEWRRSRNLDLVLTAALETAPHCREYSCDSMRLHCDGRMRGNSTTGGLSRIGDQIRLWGWYSMVVAAHSQSATGHRV